jgi:hypothetical protein
MFFEVRTFNLHFCCHNVSKNIQPMVPWSQFSKFNFREQNNFNCFSNSKQEQKDILLHLKSRKYIRLRFQWQWILILWSYGMWWSLFLTTSHCFMLVCNTTHRPTALCSYLNLSSYPFLLYLINMHLLYDVYAEAMERTPIHQPPPTLPQAVTIPFLPNIPLQLSSHSIHWNVGSRKLH